MPYNPKNVSRTLRICFPILVTIIAGFIAPDVRLARWLPDVR